MVKEIHIRQTTSRHPLSFNALNGKISENETGKNMKHLKCTMSQCASWWQRFVVVIIIIVKCAFSFGVAHLW